jgi:glycosyltransferase involved in cell wall biosynthesis
MTPLISAVIICKNEEHIIEKTLRSAQQVAAEVLLYDTGSTDATLSIARKLGIRIIESEWEGYGKSKQKAIAAAQYDWILNIDSDEVLDDVLIQSIKQLDLANQQIAYKVLFKNFLGSVQLSWGEFGFDKHIRLFNRKNVQWNDSSVHEKLVIPGNVKVKELNGRILHFTMKDTSEFVQKSVNYALLNAELYFQRGKKSTWIKQFVAPLFMFIKYYFFKLGFLDGWAGLFAARMAGLYTYVKYTRLRELWYNKS